MKHKNRHQQNLSLEYIMWSMKHLTIWAFGSGSKIRYFSDLQGKNGDRDPELLSKNPQKSDFTLCDRVFRSNK